MRVRIRKREQWLAAVAGLVLAGTAGAPAGGAAPAPAQAAPRETATRTLIVPTQAAPRETATRTLIEPAARAPRQSARGPVEIVVSAAGPVATLRAALLEARDGDVIRIRAGVYRESQLLVNAAVTLVGEPGAIIENAGTAGLLAVTANDVTIRGLTLRGAAVSHVHDHAAIEVNGAARCTIEGNRLEDNFFAIYLAKAADCRVAGNVITASNRRESASGNGIHMWSSTGVVVEDNEIRGHRDGIYLEHVSGSTMRRNVSEDNLRYGLHFMFSSENRYIGNEFRRNGAGVAVMYSKQVEVRGNTFEDNWGPTAYGLLAKEISDSRIEGNTFHRNTVGLSSEGSVRVVVTGNRFERNGWAARVPASSHQNRFTGNAFVDNTFDVTTNSRRSQNVFDGNYWSRYTGYDLTGDGIGDVPHRPVRLFSLIVERAPAALVLLRSAFVDLLEVAERVLPVLTPETLVDARPVMRETMLPAGAQRAVRAQLPTGTAMPEMRQAMRVKEARP